MALRGSAAGMTIRAKYFIDMSDLVSIRIECKRCKTTLSLAISEDLRVDSLNMCPNCKEPWFALPGSSTMQPSLADFVRSVNRMASALRDWRKAMDTLNLPGFSLELEIKGPLPE